METEKIIHYTSPSQIVNLFPFFVGILMTAGIITAAVMAENNLILLFLTVPFLFMLWKWLVVQTTKFKLTDQRIIISQGVINKSTNETELYRVRDTSVHEPFFYRIFGLGNITVYTTDEAITTHTFNAYKKPHWVKDQIRNNCEVCRQKKRWGNDNILLHDHNV